LARSFSKSILLGEHAVVFGVPAIAVGLDRGAIAHAAPAAISQIRLGNQSSATAHDGTELGTGYGALLDAAGVTNCAVEVSLEIPAGVGLGASAAIGVAVARAVFEWKGEPSPELGRVVEAAMAWERVFHGNPSGIDAWGAAYGGCFSYVRGSGIKPLAIGRDLTLAVCVAGPPASTRLMVEGVARLRDKNPDLVGKSFSAIETLARNAALAIEAGDLFALGKLLDLNQMLLAGLFVSTPEIESACAIARSSGALGAKLTGAGGGGCVIALADGDPEPILKAWRADNLQCFSSVVRALPEKVAS
jgi:mevalonate kinase